MYYKFMLFDICGNIFNMSCYYRDKIFDKQLLKSTLFINRKKNSQY